jgi:hypothetical protein
VAVHVVRTVLPPLQLLVLLVQLGQEFVAFVGDFVGGLQRRLLHLRGLDHDLRLHAHLHVFVFHYDHARLLQFGWGGWW